MEKRKNKIKTSKYTLMNFLPLNIYHQLSKPSNMFFLLTLILLTIPSISPFNPYTYLIAFCIVTGTSMVKDAIEDYRRHKQDNIINKKIVKVLIKKNNEYILQDKTVEDICEGDFVVIFENEEIPADVSVLCSKVNTRKGVLCRNYCFMDSSNLDGESNLKKKSSGAFFDCNNSNYCEESEPNDYILCDCDRYYLDSTFIHEREDTGDLLSIFSCKIKIDEKSYFCNERNILLKGMVLRNTRNVLGYVVAVGNETKVSKGSLAERKGTSLFEKELTKVIIWVFLIYFLLLLSTSILGSLWIKRHPNYYLDLDIYPAKQSFKQTGTNYILFSYLIPLSLFVTLEGSRMFHSSYISNDKQMQKGDIKSVCRNSNVSEDLGMIEYLLSDKTGTLTKNKMVFKKIHIHGENELLGLDSFCKDIVFDENRLTRGNNMNYDLLFLIALLVCNSVEPLNDKLEGVSQDEVCILEKLKKYNLFIVEKDDKTVLVNIGGEVISCTIMMCLDFSSQRQRMSIIVKIKGKLFLFSKRSDQMLLKENKIKLSQEKDGDVHRIINLNSKYRTLVVGYREVAYEEYKSSVERINEVSIEEHEENENIIFDEIENGLQYLGTTFIEDELQEEVIETIKSMKRAGIKVWVITGDKKETAVSCAIDCGIVSDSNNNDVIIQEGGDFIDSLDSLNFSDFNSAVVYRTTPHQKGEIARKMSFLRKNTLSIGDGNNDVSMLLNSSVGVGILGKEGNQAGLSGDFAVPDFKTLKRLLFIHGRYDFIRFSKITLNAFYKNIYLIMVQYLYNFFSGFSGKPVYNDVFLNYYNVFFTSLVPLSICLFDKDYPEDYLLERPELYKITRTYFCKSIAALNIFYGIFEAIFIFVVLTGCFYGKDMVSANGKIGGYNAINHIFSIVVFISVLMGQIRLISYWVSYSYIAIFLSIFFNFLFLYLIKGNRFENNSWIVLSLPVFYIALILILSIVLIMEMAFEKLSDILMKKDKEKYEKNRFKS